ncbi:MULTISPECIES: dihydroneopterin aldolase [unclassified Zymobacter]|uniref:dihydroneopterin aldolase n=1 Tax=unclassified Zymobacter TaxID=3048685 RepID=UPI0039C43833
MPTRDIVFIEGLVLETVVGVYAWEKRIHQRLVMDLEMSTDIRQAAQHDDLEGTLNYAAISEALLEFCHTHSFELIETYAERMCALLLTQFDIRHVKMTLRKPGAVPQATSVGIKIERAREVSA